MCFIAGMTQSHDVVNFPQDPEAVSWKSYMETRETDTQVVLVMSLQPVHKDQPHWGWSF